MDSADGQGTSLIYYQLGYTLASNKYLCVSNSFVEDDWKVETYFTLKEVCKKVLAVKIWIWSVP